MGGGFWSAPYYREAELQIRDSVLNKRNQYEYQFRTVFSVVISSNTLNTWYFDDLQTDAIYLRINNYDDIPLKVRSVESEVLNHYLICKLSKSGKYILKFGDNKISPANYDLKYFKDKIPQNLQIIASSNIQQINGLQDQGHHGLKLDSKYIWIAILLVAVLLIYMITKMLKEMKLTKEK